MHGFGGILHVMNNHHRRLATVLALLFLIDEMCGTERQYDGQSGTDKRHQQLLRPRSVVYHRHLGRSDSYFRKDCTHLFLYISS